MPARTLGSRWAAIRSSALAVGDLALSDREAAGDACGRCWVRLAEARWWIANQPFQAQSLTSAGRLCTIQQV